MAEKLVDDEELDYFAKKSQTEPTTELIEKVTKINVRQLQTSIGFKRERMSKIKKFEVLYQGNVPRKFRQLFNVNFPVFTSFVDTLESDFSDSITAKFREDDPSDYFKVKKIQAAWNREKLSLKPSGMWDLKIRLDRKNAIISGRGIQRYYATGEPEYESHFDVVNYNYFHCQPTGGTHLENHLFAGEEMIIKTRSQLIKGVEDGIYDEAGVRELFKRQGNQDFMKDLGEDVLAKYRALGLDPESNNYIGERSYAFCQWVSTYGGRRWYNLFEPMTKISIRFDRLKDVYSGDYMPWTSWSTHEDQQLFWNVGYGDFFYPVADAMITLINQELTNREKQNFNARAYDEEMFTDEAKLDEAQYRPDALVPGDTKSGTKKLADGVYRFDTPQLQGTINLSDWLYQQIGTLTAAGELQQGAPAKGGAKAYIQLMQQQQIAKRLSYKAQSYQECYQQIALRFIQGLKDNMDSKMAIKIVGPEGYDSWETITKLDLNLHRDPSIEIQSTTAQENADKMKSDAQVSVLTELANAPFINERTREEYLLRKGGKFEDIDVALLMDVNSSVDKEVQAKAAIAIKELVEKKKPDINYAADLTFLKLIQKFMVNHLAMLEKRGIKDDFLKYIKSHIKIAADNMVRLGKQIQAERAQAQLESKDGGQPQGQPQGKPQQPQAKKPSAKGKMSTKSPVQVQSQPQA